MPNAVQRLETLWEELCTLPSNQVGEIVKHAEPEG